MCALFLLNRFHFSIKEIANPMVVLTFDELCLIPNSKKQKFAWNFKDDNKDIAGILSIIKYH